MQQNREAVEPASPGSQNGPIKNVVVIFTKVPLAGTVKTRLVQDASLNAADAAVLAEAMLKDTIALAVESKAREIVIGFTPADEREFIEQIVWDVLKKKGQLERPVSFLPQSGTNFDERFASVVSAAFARGSDNLVVLGGDLPYLPPDIINRAFSFLSESESNNSIVLGPAGEGGVYLVGITRHFDPEYFPERLLFSGGVELSRFIQLCKSEGMVLKLLPAFTDVDVEGDLVSLLLYIDAMNTATQFDGYYFPRYTAEAITRLGLTVRERRGDTRRRRIGMRRA